VKNTSVLSADRAPLRRRFRCVAGVLGSSVVAVACSFGTTSGEDPSISPGPDVVDPAPPEGTQTDRSPPETEPREQDPGNDPGTAEPPPTAYDPDADPFSTVMGQQVAEILRLNCGGCHMGQGAKGDFGYLLSMDELIANDKVVPGNKEDSQLYNRMVGGSMPPADRRATQAPTYSQIELVGQFIDELDLPDPLPCESLELMDVDTQIQLMRDDMARLEARDQPFTRYLTINYSANAGDCGRALQRQRYALFKGINSVSTDTLVTQPAPIDDDETIYRIDIRDYGWDRPIDLQDNDVSSPANIDFEDGWEAIIANPATAAYAVEYQGDAADDLVANAGTRVPFMPVHAFIQATEFGDLYYTLIGGRASLFDFEREVLGIDTIEKTAENDLMRAGFSNSGVSKQERVLNRFDSGIAAGMSYWVSFDFDGGNGGEGANGFEQNVPNDSIFAKPLDFKFGGGEAIFSLPNGMQGYYAADGAGNRLATAPIGVVIDPAQNNGRVTNGASCHSCHNAGMISFTDSVRQFVEDNSVRFDRETFEDVMEQYPDAQTFQRQMDRDSNVHLAAAERAGVPPGTPDAVSRVYLDFQFVNIDLRIAAGELGVEPEVLRQNLASLDPRLGPLASEGGRIDRNTMTDTFLSSVCELHSVQENAPVGCP
jgi:hypothetical protein